MKIPSKIAIGYPRKDGPIILGHVINHTIPKDCLIGTQVGTKEVAFTLDVVYYPDNPRGEQLEAILRPNQPIPKNFWGGYIIEAEIILNEQPPIESPF